MLVLRIKKTIAYLKRNGLKNTVLTVMERIEQRRNVKYSYAFVGEEEIEKQKKKVFNYMPKISIVVPCYETKPVFLEDMILSVEDQTYSNYELIIIDASKTDYCNRLCNSLKNEFDNIIYKRLSDNKGIAENTNEGIKMASGEYIALLDHDDVITEDALYSVVEYLNKCKNEEERPALIYSDEDKTNEYMEKYFEGTSKHKMNIDMLLSNNYVCHLSVYKAEVLKELLLRKEYDGAQDHDLVLRLVAYLKERYNEMWTEKIHYIPKVLYHWRCFSGSSSVNTASKDYAYENGLKAVKDFLDKQGIDANVHHMKHKGFFRVEYNDVFEQRKDVCAVGGPIFSMDKCVGGAMDRKGNILYSGLRKGYTGYMNKASIQQDVDVLDIRNIVIRRSYENLFKRETGYSYPLNASVIAKMSDSEAIKKSIAFCNKARSRNINFLYDPEMALDK